MMLVCAGCVADGCVCARVAGNNIGTVGLERFAGVKTRLGIGFRC